VSGLGNTDVTRGFATITEWTVEPLNTLIWTLCPDDIAWEQAGGITVSQERSSMRRRYRSREPAEHGLHETAAKAIAGSAPPMT